jgi:hypothetical protein
MSVFLRWGIFGILGVAGLMYAYNASKQLAARRVASAAPTAVETSPTTEPAEPMEPAEPVRSNAPPHCEVELVVAQRALAARAEGQPLDRLLRIQEIAWVEPPRRQLLESVATRWYRLQGEEPTADALRIAVISDCVRFSPAP